MARLRSFALTAAATFVVVAQAATAHADPPVAAPPPKASVGTVMLVLDALGLADKGAPSPAARAHVAVRTPTWLQPEPPKTPLFYSSLVVAKF